MEEPSRFGKDIAAILERCEKGQHQWVIDDLEATLASSWMKARAPWDVTDTVAEKSFRAQIDEPSGKQARPLLLVTTESAPLGAAGEFIESPERARQILEQAVQLILENGTADWHFVRAVARSYARSELLLAMKNQWILPDHAGGKGEFRKRFDELVRRGIPPWRIAVLMDSDRLAPGPLPEDNDKKRKQLEALGVRVFVLHKREAENYLPPSLLDGRDLRNTHSSLRTLLPEQQDHYDMKRGFKSTTLTTTEEPLFGKVSEWHRKRLVGGFGPSIGDRFKDANIDREEMDEMCSTCPGELEGILQALEEML